jgi:hypothetical protein
MQKNIPGRLWVFLSFPEGGVLPVAPAITRGRDKKSTPKFRGGLLFTHLERVGVCIRVNIPSN